AAVDVRRVEGTRRELRLVESAADVSEAARAVAEVEVEHARLPRHQPGHVALARHVDERVERRLAGAVVRDRELPEPDDLGDVDDVAADAPGEGRRGEVVAARPRPRREALAAEGSDLPEQPGRRP